jgi:hypothetical protein
VNLYRLAFSCRLLIIVLVVSFSIFPKTLLRWIPLSAWVVILLGFAVLCLSTEMTLRYRQGMKIATNKKT